MNNQQKAIWGVVFFIVFVILSGQHMTLLEYIILWVVLAVLWAVIEAYYTLKTQQEQTLKDAPAPAPPIKSPTELPWYCDRYPIARIVVNRYNPLGDYEALGANGELLAVGSIHPQQETPYDIVVFRDVSALRQFANDISHNKNTPRPPILFLYTPVLDRIKFATPV